MGWDFGYSSKQEAVDALTQTWSRVIPSIKSLHDGGKETTRTVAHKVVGGVLWSVVETEVETFDKVFARYQVTSRTLRIDCILLKKDRKFGWGYKHMSECEGPCYYTCPLAFLQKAPVAEGPYAVEWREKVREYHARKAA